MIEINNLQTLSFGRVFFSLITQRYLPMKCNCNQQNNELLKAFCTYTNNYESSEEVDALKMQYLVSAREVVQNYLGYRLDIHDVTEYHVFTGSNDFYLRECPPIEVYSVKVNGESLPAPFYSLRGDHVRLNDCCHCHHGEVEIQYCAGFRKIPDLITQTILRIASLLQTESNSNIGITSRSYGTDGSRSFLNFTSFEKYLQPLYPFRTYKLT